MSTRYATALASPNIALIKYWGNRDQALRLPSNSSISMALAGLETTTTVVFDSTLDQDTFSLQGHVIAGDPLDRVSRHLDHIRNLAGVDWHASVESWSNFPPAAGLASSASAFAALTLAASHAAGLDLDQQSLSRLARLGSGSASRSVCGGFVELHAADTHAECYSESIAPSDHWPLVDVIALIDVRSKRVGSTAGHALAVTSPLQEARVQDAPRRLKLCRQAILARDFPLLASTAEQDSNMMHAVMMTSSPPLVYWQPGTLAVTTAVTSWRAAGLPVFYTIDAGPNVHCLCTQEASDEVCRRLTALSGVSNVISAGVGYAAHILPTDETHHSPVI